MSRRRAFLAAAGLVLVGLVFAVFLPRIASYSSVWRVASAMSGGWLAAVLAATAVNVATFAFPWMVALRGLGFLNAVQMTQASTAFTFVVPGGAALGMGVSFGMLRSWGFGRREVGRAVALTGIWNQLSTFLFPVVAAIAVASDSAHGGTVGVIALFAVAVFVACAALLGAAFWRERVLLAFVRLARSLIGVGTRLLRRRPPSWTDDDARRFRRETIDAVRSSWPALTLATVANQLTSFVVLDLSLRAVGIGLVQITVAESFAAWSVGRLLASLPLTPGGLGFIELGMTGMLVGFGGRQAQVVAGVLVYRVLTLASTSLAALVSLASWNRFRPDEVTAHE